MAGMLWNVLKFDYGTEAFTGGFWDLADVDYFVDSALGSDAAAGTYDAPFKTLSKVKSLGAGIWENGLVVMINGIFTEDIVINKAVRFVGAGGGYNGRTIINNGGGTTQLRLGADNAAFDNIRFINYNNAIHFSATGNARYITYFCNCRLNSQKISVYNTEFVDQYAYYTSFMSCLFDVHTAAGTGGVNITGSNNVLYNTTIDGASLKLDGDNNVVNNAITITGAGTNNLTNTDARYFTDSGEGTIADLFIDSALGNFDFLKTISFWDHDTSETIVVNPLYRAGTFNLTENIFNHIGSGYEANVFTANDTAFKSTVDGGDATYTNIATDGFNLYRINEGIDGIVESGIIDLGGLVTQGLGTNLYHSFGVDGGEIYRRVQETTTNTYREGFDYIVQYGITSAQIADCPELLMEIGKTWSVSGDGASRVGNADPTFDPSLATPVIARYVKYILKLRNA